MKIGLLGTDFDPTEFPALRHRRNQARHLETLSWAVESPLDHRLRRPPR
jgi:hypothetical protein